MASRHLTRAERRWPAAWRGRTISAGGANEPPAAEAQAAEHDQPSDRALVELARTGDADAFAAIVRRYQSQIFGLTYRIMGDPDDASDLTQECFARAFRALPRTRRELNLPAWLHRIAANACLDVLRRRQRFRWLSWDGDKHDQLLLSQPGDDPEHSALSGEDRDIVQQVLDRMRPRYRIALTLREYEGLSCDEIGQLMGCASRSAVKSLLFRGREEFRRIHETIDCQAPER